MKLFRIFDTSKQRYVTDINEWVIDIDVFRRGTPCS